MNGNFNNFLFRDALTSNMEHIIEWKTNNGNDQCFDDFFSLIEWNPLNICRAPDDVHRKGYPNQYVDMQVISLFYKVLHEGNTNIANTDYILNKTPNLISLAFKIIKESNNINAFIPKYIAFLNHNMETIARCKMGYYSFLWGKSNLDPKKYSSYYSPYTGA